MCFVPFLSRQSDWARVNTNPLEFLEDHRLFLGHLIAELTTSLDEIAKIELDEMRYMHLASKMTSQQAAFLKPALEIEALVIELRRRTVALSNDPAKPLIQKT